MALQKMAKNTVSPYDVRGSQNAKHGRPHAKVSTPDVLMRLHLSLTMPMTGRPTAVTKFKKPIKSVACALENPIERAKSDKTDEEDNIPQHTRKCPCKR